MFLSNPAYDTVVWQSRPTKDHHESIRDLRRALKNYFPKTYHSTELHLPFSLAPERYQFCIIGTHNWRVSDSSLLQFAKLWVCPYGCLSAGSAKGSVQFQLQVMRSVSPKLQTNFSLCSEPVATMSLAFFLAETQVQH